MNTYDLLVLDINLPGVDGFYILEKLRESDINTRVIIVSANREIEDRIKGLDLGANDYLVKPFDFLELTARIRALLRREFVSKPSIGFCISKVVYKIFVMFCTHFFINSLCIIISFYNTNTHMFITFNISIASYCIDKFCSNTFSS